MRFSSTAFAVVATLLTFGPASTALAAGGAGGGGGGGGGVPAAGGTTTGADLQVSGSASSGALLPGAQLDYTFQIKNSGPSDATGVTLTDVLPAGVTFEGSSIPSNPPEPCVATDGASGTALSCGLGTIPRGGQQTVVIFTSAGATPGVYANTGTASSPIADPKPTNNSATMSVTIKPFPVCPLPAGQTSTTGTVQSDNFDANGQLTGFVLQNAGGAHVVNTNFDALNGPTTSLINLLCKPVGFVFAGPGNTVTVTGTDAGSGTVPGLPAPVPAINASVVRSLSILDVFGP
jgi:uncharacterized repeat protein (TIGR01451 family)